VSYAQCSNIDTTEPEDGADKGIIPLTTLELFRRVEERSALDINLSYTVEVSYIEIYNEKSAIEFP